jgi:GMP synthase (glutamine-hydrolysing)
MQLVCETLGGQVWGAPAREFGRRHCQITQDSDLLAGLPEDWDVWMSHGDQVMQVSDEFVPLAKTDTCPLAAVQHRTLPVFGLQFHPEVTHTAFGREVLANFLLRI